MKKLYHFSEESDIECFVPRPSTRNDRQGNNYVWAICEAKLPNYLLPRDCPRVIFWRIADSKPTDVERLMTGTSAQTVIAIEKKWLPIIQQTTLYQYEMNPANFYLDDENAGYYVSEQVEIPIAKIIIPNIISELFQHAIELRMLPSLWELREQVIHSSLGFSIIRMRNASPPPEGYNTFYWKK